MRRLLTNILTICLLCSCTKEFTPFISSGDTWVDIPFGSSDNIVMTTKAHQSYSSENMVHNLFVFIFDEHGNKVYDRYFNVSDLVSSEVFASAAKANTECWTVTNTTSEGTQTTGKFRINCPQGSNLQIYLVVNMDSDRVYISSELLSRSVNNLSDLQNFKLYLNVDSVERGTKFAATGFITGVNIADGVVTGASTIQLTRCDAKVKVTFRTGSRPDENGQTIKNFIPEKWRIINVPRYSYLLEGEHDATNANSINSEFAAGFFDTDWKVFDDFNSNTSGSFSFYMLENRLEPKQIPTNFQDRSRRLKDAQGLNQSTEIEYQEPNGKTVTKTIRNFEYANDFSTYIMVSGTVEMELENDTAGQVLGGKVEYLVHLGGEWTSSIDSNTWKDDEYQDVSSYDTKRNHSYHYIVTVNSVNNIRVEVETSDGVKPFLENQPGAWGDVTIAKEEIAICDAHYVSKTMSFHAANLVKEGVSFADDLTWAVSTPFSEDVFIDPVTTPLSTLDYQWVHFRLNKKDEEGIYYADKRRKYTPRQFVRYDNFRSEMQNLEDDGTPGLAGFHNDGIMNIVELVEYMKEQADLYALYQRTAGAENTSDFDSSAPDPSDPFTSGPKISVTVFVDEYFYDRNPLSGTQSDVLWKRFVNADDRYMHILSNSHTSFDKDSRMTGSVVTIQQKSIQSIYNIYKDEGLVRAWGLEHEDEFPDMWEWVNTSANNNYDRYNGYINTLKLWDLCGGSSTSFNTGRLWSTYMDIEVENEVPQLNSVGDYDNLRYSCMARNRDNNGDGIIDQNEIRWYTASIGQLVNLYMGEACISMSSRLYNRDPDIRLNPSATTHQWQQHVASSTHLSNDKGTTIVWGEEGISTGGSLQLWGSSPLMSVRCVRNLGMENVDNLTNVYETLVEVTDRVEGSNTYKVYDMSNLMPQSKRDYTSEELPFHFETGVENLIYDKFEANYTNTTTGGYNKFESYNDELNKRILNSQALFCPNGYRTPNQKELAVMMYFSKNGESPILTGVSSLCRTAFSMGSYQDNPNLKKEASKTGFIVHNGNLSLDAGPSIGTVRCVRDVRVN